MSIQEPIVLQQRDLPRPVVIIGASGETVVYELKPAGRRNVGACLNKPCELLEQYVRESLRK